MGFKDFIAGKIAGSLNYGKVLGNHSIEYGILIAKGVFKSHGIRSGSGSVMIFQDIVEMEKNGFTPIYYKFKDNNKPTLDHNCKLLYEQIKYSMISFDWINIINCSRNLMSHNNFSKFEDGFTSSIIESLISNGIVKDNNEFAQLIAPYLRIGDTFHAIQNINMDKPGVNDMLEKFILHAGEFPNLHCQYGFIRTGISGFDRKVIDNIFEILESIHKATSHYEW